MKLLFDDGNQHVGGDGAPDLHLHCVLTTSRYTHLTDQTKDHAIDRINGLMDSFSIDWGRVK